MSHTLRSFQPQDSIGGSPCARRYQALGCGAYTLLTQECVLKTGVIGDLLFCQHSTVAFAIEDCRFYQFSATLTVSYVHKCLGFALPMSMRRFTLEEGVSYTVGFRLET
jgi:hypothetical protein